MVKKGFEWFWAIPKFPWVLNFVPWLFPDSLRLESDTFSGLAVRRWLLVKTGFCLPRLWERSRSRRLWKLSQIALIAFAPFPVRSWKGWARNLLKLGLDERFHNTWPFFCLGDFIILVCSQFLFSQYPCTSLTTHSQVVFPHVFQRLHFHGAFSVTGQGHREEKIMEGQGWQLWRGFRPWRECWGLAWKCWNARDEHSTLLRCKADEVAWCGVLSKYTWVYRYTLYIIVYPRII